MENAIQKREANRKRQAEYRLRQKNKPYGTENREERLNTYISETAYIEMKFRAKELGISQKEFLNQAITAYSEILRYAITRDNES